jgi:hypothetical protein
MLIGGKSTSRGKSSRGKSQITVILAIVFQKNIIDVQKASFTRIVYNMGFYFSDFS